VAYCSKCKEEFPDGTFCPACGVSDIETAAPPASDPGSKNFFTSLFDFDIKEMITPNVIRVVFILGVVGIGLAALAIIISSLGAALGPYNNWENFVAALIFAPLGALILIILFRIYLEIILLLFYIYDEVKDIKKNINR